VSRDYHVPVLLDEAVERLFTEPNALYVDGTLGGGGHAQAVAQRLGPDGLLVGVDRDEEALAEAAGWVAAYPDRVRLVQGDFGDLKALLAAQGVGPAQGILLDLGVSSRQLDDPGRGFSFLRDGPLDMRMDPSRGYTAADLVEGLGEEELARLFRDYGEEPRARRAAGAIVRARKRRPIRTTGELARIIEEALGRRGEKHPGTRIFQALRIAVNRELDSLERFLKDLPDLLCPGGRVVVISYHSLEDRRVKQALRAYEPHCRCPAAAVRCTCGEPGWLRPLGRKALKAGRTEIEANPRARSARLRAAERLPGTSDCSRQGGPP